MDLRERLLGPVDELTLAGRSGRLTVDARWWRARTRAARGRATGAASGQGWVTVHPWQPVTVSRGADDPGRPGWLVALSLDHDGGWLAGLRYGEPSGRGSLAPVPDEVWWVPDEAEPAPQPAP